MVQGITAALNKAFRIPDVRVFIREYSSAEVSHDGCLDPGGVKPSFPCTSRGSRAWMQSRSWFPASTRQLLDFHRGKEPRERRLGRQVAVR
jgi:hypothetical protein